MASIIIGFFFQYRFYAEIWNGPSLDCIKRYWHNPPRHLTTMRSKLPAAAVSALCAPGIFLNSKMNFKMLELLPHTISVLDILFGCTRMVTFAICISNIPLKRYNHIHTSFSYAYIHLPTIQSSAPWVDSKCK